MTVRLGIFFFLLLVEFKMIMYAILSKHASLWPKYLQSSFLGSKNTLSIKVEKKTKIFLCMHFGRCWRSKAEMKQAKCFHYRPNRVYKTPGTRPGWSLRGWVCATVVFCLQYSHTHTLTHWHRNNGWVLDLGQHEGWKKTTARWTQRLSAELTLSVLALKNTSQL